MSKFLSQVDLEQAFYRMRPPVSPLWRDADFAELRKLAEYESWKAKRLAATCGLEIGDVDRQPDSAIAA